jgi:hypothetical protein
VRGLVKSFRLGSDLRTVQEMKDTVGVVQLIIINIIIKMCKSTNKAAGNSQCLFVFWNRSDVVAPTRPMRDGKCVF